MATLRATHVVQEKNLKKCNAVISSHARILRHDLEKRMLDPNVSAATYSEMVEMYNLLTNLILNLARIQLPTFIEKLKRL